MATDTVTMPQADVDAQHAQATADAVKLGMNAHNAKIYADAQVREAKREYRRSNKVDAPRDNATFAFLEIVADSLLRASEQFDLPDEAYNYVVDLADVLAATVKTDSTYLSGTLRTRGGDVAILPKAARRRRNGQNNGAATPSTK